MGYKSMMFKPENPAQLTEFINNICKHGYEFISRSGYLCIFKKLPVKGGGRVYTVHKCGDCGNFVEGQEYREYNICEKLDKVVDPDEMPEDCPLPEVE